MKTTSNAKSHSLALAAIAAVTFGAGLAHAQDGEGDPAAAPQGETLTTPEGVKVDANGVPLPPPPEPKGAEFGINLRLRNVRLPQGLLELFVDRASGGSSEVGFGLDLVRRRDNFELHVGLEYDPINVPAGTWIEKGKTIPGNEVDYVQFNGFGWVALEANFINHHPLAKQVSLRYGGGAGLAFLLGDVTHIDRACTSSDVNSCTLDTNGGQKIKYDLKSPVYPLITGLIGVQYRPADKVAINVELGLRTVLPFFGVSGTYFF